MVHIEDHLRFGSFAVQFGDHFRSGDIFAPLYITPPRVIILKKIF